MTTNIRQVKDLESMLNYFAEKLNWQIDFDSFYDIDDITYGFDANDIGLKNEEFSKISSLRQLRPLVDNQAWGIFAIEFDSKRFEITALRKVLSGLVPKRRNSEHAMWDKKNLLFLCFWGEEFNRTVGAAYFEDKEAGLPQVKIIYSAPKVEDFNQIEKFENKLSNLTWPADTADYEEWHKQWAEAFTTVYRQVIRDSQTLTIRLAAIAKSIKERILNILYVETANGYVHLLYDKFRKTLIHDMTEEQFADMYAQTVAYGLFSARCLDTDDHFNPEEAIDHIPNTNPFLKKLMKECFAKNNSKLSFDELELNDIIELLNNSDTDTILADFNRQTGGGKEDPVIYFYEGFLNAYESEQKKRRGVYYTPQPVVNFIVRAVDDILKTEFGYESGLASTQTKTINIRRESKIKVGGMMKMVDDTEEVPAIQILDPATGTGTFLRQTILQIWDNFKMQHKGKSDNEVKRLWNRYVPMHLLPRLNGFELMMAPYAVAHMKLAMILKETGYDFSGDERVNVFLTNSLEEAGNSEMQIKFWEDPLATESIEANQVKKNKAINVVIGNPPYSGESANKSAWIMELMEDYKQEPGGLQKLQEKNPKAINDDYVKFIRYAQRFVDQAGAGIVAYINPHGFLDNPTFRGMRWNLMQSFDDIYVIDLHGNTRKNETCPDGSKDENVFDIQQGVSINLFIKHNLRKAGLSQIHHLDMYGTREVKYSQLLSQSMQSLDFKTVELRLPYLLYKPVSFDENNKYSYGFYIGELFQQNSMGVATARDALVIDFERSTLLEKVSTFGDISTSDSEIRRWLYPNKADVNDTMGDTGTWYLTEARRNIAHNQHENYVHCVSYRPFDCRYIYYSRDLIDRPREEIMQHMLEDNYALCLIKINRDDRCTVLVSNHITDKTLISSKDNANVFPLFHYEQTFDGTRRSPNLCGTAIKQFSKKLGLPYSPNSNGGNWTSIAPVDIFDYIYAVLHSPRYREIYKQFLKIDFPRVPYPTDQELFWVLVELGNQLRKLHLMEAPELGNLITQYPVPGNNIVERLAYVDGCVFINRAQYFSGVPQVAWEFYIGSYQPAQKWLKDRKGRELSKEDILHYQRVIIALTETDRIMKEIDNVIEF